MMKTKSYAAIAVGVLVGMAGSAWAQTGPADAAHGGPANPSAVGGDGSPEIRAPVLRITSVEVIRSTHGPTLDIIRVRGLASSSGWEEAELVPLTRGTPADGMLELVFVARAPTEAMEATGFEAIEAIFPLETSHPFKGVNVHSASDSVTLTQLPGYTEGKAPGEDCSKCVGKLFVAKGAAVPAGKSASEVIKEEQLPSMTRVIRHTDGIPTADSNPNRLTIVLNKEGRISTAIWD
jgi:hypothetical protein